MFPIFKPETFSLLFVNCHFLTPQCCSTKTFLSSFLSLPFFGLKSPHSFTIRCYLWHPWGPSLSFVDFFQLVFYFCAADTAFQLDCPVTGSAHPPAACTAVPNNTFLTTPRNWRITLPLAHLVTIYTLQMTFCQTPGPLALPYLWPFILLLLRKQSFGLIFVELCHSFSAQIVNSSRSFRIHISPEMCSQHSHLGVICQFSNLSLFYENVG